MDKACHFCSSVLRLYCSERQRFPLPSDTPLPCFLSWKPEFNFEYFRLMFKWQCLQKRKKNCAALLLPEDIIGVRILNVFLQLSRSCYQLEFFYLMCGYFAWWYSIKTLTWVEGCWFKTSLRSTKISCCTFVLLVVVEASYFLWTSLDVLALGGQL